MTMDEVLAIDTQPYVDLVTDSMLFMSGAIVVGLTADITYRFNPAGELYGMAYTFRDDYPSPEECLTDFVILREGLIKKYGAPTSDDEAVTADTIAEHVMGLVEDTTYFLVSFDTEEVEVRLSLSRGTTGYLFRLRYNSRVIPEDAPDRNL
jgi:hypothetical protein